MKTSWKDLAARLVSRRALAYGGLAAFGLGACGFALSPLLAEPQQIAVRIEEAPQSHALIPALKMAAESLAELEHVKDYQATLVKKEKVGELMLTARMEIKFRENPRAVYLKFLEPHAGREVLYRPDQNAGNLLVHDVGLASLVGSVSLDPTGALAMEENRYPISQIGLKRLMEMVLDQWLKETRIADTTVNYYPNAKIGGVPCRVIEVSHAKKHPDVVNHMTRLYLDASSNLPVRIQNYDYPKAPGEKPELVEDYYYMDLRTNVGLTDADFDSTNSKYGF
jgi:hypothetical protein